jgi:pSer/pThr/pTyr-binding forkhead associated (FHA) protein
VLRIRLDDGQDLEVGSSLLIGRNPAAMTGELVEQLVPVSDPGRSISKTHLQLRREGDGVWVTDRNSTNGSAVTTPDGIQTKLVPGEAVFIRPGSTVQFGDRFFHLGQA